MIKLILNPYEGVGNIKIGMTKDDISNVLNITPKTFMKSEDEFVDDFKMMHVYYNDQHKSIAFEIFPEIEVKFKGINLTKNKIEIVKKAFEKSIPIMCSYLFVSIAYGVMMNEAGFAWYVAILVSFLIYTGAFQFLLITLLIGGEELLYLQLVLQLF